MNKLALFGLGIAAAIAVGMSSSSASAAPKTADEKISGPPKSPRLAYRVLKSGETTKDFRIGPAVMLIDGKPIPPGDVESRRKLSREVRQVWETRQKFLPKDAKPHETDGYSKELYWVPSWLYYVDPAKLNSHDLIAGGNGMPVDEFGRPMPGHYGESGQDLWNQTLGGLLKNPLFKSVAIGALVASGPQGAAIYGAYTMWEARGKGLTPTNLLLTTGRAYAVSQCGPGCGVAFDFGVGVASGKSVDKSAEDALLKEMTPAQQEAFNRGKVVVRQVS